MHPDKWRKKKVVLVLGYIGSNYFGVQRQPTLIEDTHKTIEGELSKALHHIGCISNENISDLSKIGWSRYTNNILRLRAICVTCD